MTTPTPIERTAAEKVQRVGWHALIDRRITLVVHETPCRVVCDGSGVLTETVTGVLVNVVKMPAGPIGFLKTDDGSQIAFDAGLDLKNGRVTLELDGAEYDAAVAKATALAEQAAQ